MDDIRLMNYWSYVNATHLALVSAAIIGLAHAIPYFSDRYGLRRYPGPLLAKVSSLWFANHVFRHQNITAVHEIHEKYGMSICIFEEERYSTLLSGAFIRITPKHISIADPEALQAIYGSSSGALKSGLYDGFVDFAQNPSMFTTRKRDVHSRKRKYLFHVMSMKSIQELEPIIVHHHQVLVQRWDAIYAESVKRNAGATGSCTWTTRDGRVWFNCIPCR